MESLLHRLGPAAAAAFVMALAPFAPALQGPDEPDGAVLRAPGLESLELGGQLRLRFESRDPAPPTTAGRSMSNGSARIRLHLDAVLDDTFGAFVQFQESIASQGSVSMSSVRQAVGRARGLADGRLDLEAGRMELNYGMQRMISPLDWSQTGRAWDGGRAIFREGEIRADLFWTQAVQNQGAPYGGVDFGGVYAQWAGDPITVDVYALRRRDEMIGVSDTTLGALLRGAYDGWNWHAEGASQSGDHGPLDAGGYAVAAGIEHVFRCGSRLGARYELASGDADPTDGQDDTFRLLFDFGHAYQGHADIVRWQNLQDIVVTASVPAGGGFDVHSDLHLLSLHERADALYPGAGAAGATASGSASDLGTEVDVYVKGPLGDSVAMWAGVSQFFAGDALAAGDDQTWIFVQGVLSF
ncbi:MAG TPA: alginate export family protein [Planctomycetota bacterium]